LSMLCLSKRMEQQLPSFKKRCMCYCAVTSTSVSDEFVLTSSISEIIKPRNLIGNLSAIVHQSE